MVALRPILEQLGYSAQMQQEVLGMLVRGGALTLPQAREILRQDAEPDPHPQGDDIQPKLLLLDPAILQVEAETYQFRHGGDEKGVTEEGRFKDEKWDPALHGVLLVHKRKDGYFVADGHHRRDLAARLNAGGNGPGNIPAYVYDEADGYTAKDMKIIAAFANIAHGKNDVQEAGEVLAAAATDIDHPERLPKIDLGRGTLPEAAGVARKIIQDRGGAVIPSSFVAQLTQRGENAVPSLCP